MFKWIDKILDRGPGIDVLMEKEDFAAKAQLAQLVEIQGIMDTFRLATDTEVLDQISKVIKAIDINKLKALMDMLHVEDDKITIEVQVRIK